MHETCRKELWRDNTTASPPKNLERELKCNAAEDNHYRLILVEDTSPLGNSLLTWNRPFVPVVPLMIWLRKGLQEADRGLSIRVRLDSKQQSESKEPEIDFHLRKDFSGTKFD